MKAHIFLESLGQDLKQAFRGCLSAPGFTAAVILVAALGIGPSTAVFSVVDRLLLRPLPYAHQERIVSVGITAPLDTNEFMFADEYNDLRRDTGPFDAVTAFQAGAYDCDLTEQNPIRVRCLKVEANFLSTLGIQPVIGRTFTPAEDSPNAPRVALISHGLWQSRFSGANDVIGRTLPLDGASVVIVGVLPPSFETPTLTPAAVLVPMALSSTEQAGRAFRVFGRLKPGTTPMQAWQQLQPHFQRALLTVPPQFRKEIGLRVQPVRDRQVGDARLASYALSGAVLAVLLIACANIGTLLLARAVARRREMSMRAALGASRWRLARQTLTESLLLALLGGAAGVALAALLLRTIVSMAPDGLPRLDQASLDWRVLIFALAASILFGLAFGVIPAFRRPDAALIGGWRTMGGAHQALRSVLVILQIAVSIVLLTGAGLLLRSLWNLQRVPLGMEADHVITAKFVLGKQRYARDVDQVAFFRQLEERLSAIPGVEAAAITDSLPPSGGTRSRPLNTIEVEGQPRRPEGTGGMVAWRYVTPGYFRALHVPVRRGRTFHDEDRGAEANALVLSSSFAAMLFPHEDPIGRHILKDAQGRWSTVVGVVADVRNSGLTRETAPEYYVVRKTVADPTYANHDPQVGWRAATVVLRTAVDPAIVAASLRSTIGELDPTLPVEVETMRRRLDSVVGRPRFNAALLTLFAGIGVLLAAVGLYGVVAFLVGQRTQEIGVRMALGATPGAIVALVLRLAARWTLAGIVLGIGASIFAAGILRTLLFGIPARDPWTLLLVSAVLLLVALAASWVPSRRAAGIDPITALRHD